MAAPASPPALPPVSLVDVAQQRIIEAYAEFEKLKKQLDNLEKLTPNTPKGEHMLWKKKRALCDEMTAKLDIVQELSRVHEGAGSVPTVQALRRELKEQVLNETTAQLRDVAAPEIS